MAGKFVLIICRIAQCIDAKPRDRAGPQVNGVTGSIFQRVSTQEIAEHMFQEALAAGHVHAVVFGPNLNVDGGHPPPPPPVQ